LAKTKFLIQERFPLELCVFVTLFFKYDFCLIQELNGKVTKKLPKNKVLDSRTISSCSLNTI